MSRLPDLYGCAGAAFLLSCPAHDNLEFTHPEGRVLLRQGTVYATVCLNALNSPEETKSKAWRVIQESLDMLAATGRAVLATSKGDTEYSIWRLVDGAYELTCVQTGEFQWSMEAHGTGGGVGPQSASILPYTHHDSLRFYRMSRCSSDLFDSYRNAYLALECLVSDESAKMRNEKELEWLKRVVKGTLSGGVPGGINVNQLLEAVYRNGRNPLFHAKTGESFYPPHGEQREEIQELFEQLTLLFVSLVQYKLGTHTIRR